MSKVAGGWQVNWILSRTSGTPFTVGTSGTSVNAPGNTQTADQVLPTVAILGGHGVGQPYFDPNAFAPVTDGPLRQQRPQHSARAGRVQPGWQPVPRLQDDGAVQRCRSARRCFGVTNTPQFGNPGATASSLTRNADGTIRALNGFTEITSASGERQFRFAAKITF